MPSRSDSPTTETGVITEWGDWRVGERNGGGIEIRAVSNNFLVARASVPDSRTRGKEWSEDNKACEESAKLIAAAPAMLRALRVIADFAPGYGDVCEIIAQKARDAIKEAI